VRTRKISLRWIKIILLIHKNVYGNTYGSYKGISLLFTAKNITQNYSYGWIEQKSTSAKEQER
jgi:5-methylcytosine-specific restriction endonuclease McrBC regulatory subunit McrC